MVLCIMHMKRHRKTEKERQSTQADALPAAATIPS